MAKLYLAICMSFRSVEKSQVATHMANELYWPYVLHGDKLIWGTFDSCGLMPRKWDEVRQ